SWATCTGGGEVSGPTSRTIDLAPFTVSIIFYGRPSASRAIHYCHQIAVVAAVYFTGSAAGGDGTDFGNLGSHHSKRSHVTDESVGRQQSQPDRSLRARAPRRSVGACETP